ncbi:hypothetical protein N7462_010872 [Penicillium macrosclerotiorum]|uniref:uncharacterized protein n=1 Tax=Penicillium macrosclerotiorum TaxID=303699 RepID=UPI0025499DF8|nr:uncharacterized protein N7462_010872 [Penicillium macrosclerotiorum]KAJ5669802.1 hypothetical protein N7462_010872 [Penicillium macrosclerotiorum]
MTSNPPGLRLAQLPLLIWQFTESNFPTFVLPNSSFGLLAASAAPLLTDRPCRLSLGLFLVRGLQVVLFNWANVFIFDLANQRLPESICEDRLNKPWRPLLTRRISPDGTRRLMLVAIPMALALSAALRVGTESALILVLTWLYNDLHGGDEIIRDVIISFGYGLYLTGSLRIAIGPGYHITGQGYRWITMVSGVVLTTMQVQDLKDQTGDRARGRKTLPIVLGDTLSRWSITSFLFFWSVLGAFFWDIPPWGYALPVLTGAWVGFHVVSRANDAAAWRWWCLWQIVIYALPGMVALRNLR